MKKGILFIFALITSFVQAQDTASTKSVNVDVTKKYTHEINFNGTFLVKQLISNNPSASLTQLPYLVNYQVGFGNKYGARFGLGIEQSVQKTSIQGQIAPRTTTLLVGSYRLDVCRQLVNYKKFSCVMYFGFISDHSKLESSTVTDQGGGNTLKSDLTNKSMGYGGEVGLAVKYSFNKHIGLGAEIPLQCKYTLTDELDKQTFNSSVSSTSSQTISKGSLVSTKIFLPTSVYICVTF